VFPRKSVNVRGRYRREDTGTSCASDTPGMGSVSPGLVDDSPCNPHKIQVAMRGPQQLPAGGVPWPVIAKQGVEHRPLRAREAAVQHPARPALTKSRLILKAHGRGG